MFLRRFFLFLVALLVFSGCTHGLMRGSVAMKVSDTEAHVCIDDSEAKVGERVSLYKNKCSNSTTSGRLGLSKQRCEKAYLGQGTITEILNQHYSVVKFDPGVSFEEGTFIEKR